MKKTCIVCDIDGTVALMMGKRTPFEYHKAFEDVPNQPVIDVLLATVRYYAKMNKNEPIHIIFTSARENVVFDGNFIDNDGNITKTTQFYDVAELTKVWVNKHIGESEFNHFIFRKAGDYRKDAFVKFEIGKKILEEYNILCVFDDRNQVVDMWRNGLGLTCFQVADGNF
tara:strand:+ start:511 stop:1020 length:510 start_codon:yes stop_codon:yes gene_type:complete